jgi:hypothetical protein
MLRLFPAILLLAVLVAACGSDSPSVEKVCGLNDEFAALNERTIPLIDVDPFPDPAMLEENFTEGVKLLRGMVEAAPDEIQADLSDYTDANAELSEIYADFGYDRAAVPQEERDRFDAEYKIPDTVHSRIMDWFVSNCGLELQG